MTGKKQYHKHTYRVRYKAAGVSSLRQLFVLADSPRGAQKEFYKQYMDTRRVTVMVVREER